PIAGVVPTAREAGARVVIVNAEPTEMDALADAVLRGPISELLPGIVGEGGPWEELKGALHCSVDPAHPANARITDLALAPRDADGRVAFRADVSLLLPGDRARGNGRAVLDVVHPRHTVT